MTNNNKNNNQNKNKNKNKKINNPNKDIVNYNNKVNHNGLTNTTSSKGFHPSPILKHTNNNDFITAGVYLNMLVILAVMIAVMLGGFYVLKKFGITKRLSNRKSSSSRLEIMDSLGVDTKTKIVLVRRDKNEHLIAINSQGNVTVIEQNIKHDPTPINFDKAIQDELKK